MPVLALVLPFLIKTGSTAIEIAATALTELLRTRIGWGILGAVVGAALAAAYVTAKWDADIDARVARSRAAQAMEEMRQRNNAAISLEMSRIRADALDDKERELDRKLKEPASAKSAADDRDGLSLGRVRAIRAIH